MVTLSIYGMPFYEMADIEGYFIHYCMLQNHTWRSLSQTTIEVLNISSEDVSVFLLQDCMRPIIFRKEGVFCLVKGVSRKPEWTSDILDKLSRMLIDCINELIRKLLPENRIKVRVVID